MSLIFGCCTAMTVGRTDPIKEQEGCSRDFKSRSQGRWTNQPEKYHPEKVVSHQVEAANSSKRATQRMPDRPIPYPSNLPRDLG